MSNLVKHHLEYITKLDSIIFGEGIVSETSIQKNWWNFTSSIFNKEYKINLNQKNLYSEHWLKETPSVFYEENFVEILPLEYKKEEIEETNLVEVLQENKSILRELFYKEVQKETASSETYVEHQKKGSNLVEKIYEKYAKEQEKFFVDKVQNSSTTKFTIELVENLWKNTKEITKYVKNNIERSLLSKEIVPLFSKQEWINNLISDGEIKEVEHFISNWKKETIKVITSIWNTNKKESSISNWNTEFIEKIVSAWNLHHIDKLTTISDSTNIQVIKNKSFYFNNLLQENSTVFEEIFAKELPLEYKKEMLEETNFAEALKGNSKAFSIFKQRNLQNNDFIKNIEKKLFYEHRASNSPQGIHRLFSSGLGTLVSDVDKKFLTSNYPKVVAELILQNNRHISEDFFTENTTQNLFFRKNVMFDENKNKSNVTSNESLEQTIVYKLEKKSEATKEILNKEIKSFIYSQVEQIIQSKIEDYEIRRNKDENQKIDDALEKIVEKKTKEQRKTSQIQIEDFDIEEIYEKVYQKIERNLRSEMRKTGR